MGDAPFPRLAYGPSKSMISHARSDEFRSLLPDWSVEGRTEAVKRCYKILEKNPQVVRIAPFSRRPAPGQTISGSDSTTVFNALCRIRDHWDDYKSRVDSVYTTLKEKVYDKQDQNLKSWADIHNRWVSARV